jgi:hypothetical protein
MEDVADVGESTFRGGLSTDLMPAVLGAAGIPHGFFQCPLSRGMTGG